MCGRFTLRTPTTALADRFLFTLEEEQLTPRYNIAPTQSVLGVRTNEEGEREGAILRWGLVPRWAKDLKIGNTMINARGETVAEKRSFKPAFQSRRCLILTDGYFEWLRKGKNKIPHYYQMKDEEPFAFAGLWERWNDRESDKTVESCTIITTAANPMAAKVHDRMPVILDSDAIDIWLNPEITAREQLQPLIQSYSEDNMKTTIVSRHVNNARNDDPQCIEEAEEVEES